jgi:hypothetical protein
MISRRSFSRTANLGQLYDANNDLLLPSNILNLNEKTQVENAIKCNKNEYVEHDFLYAYSNDDQYKHLDIDYSLRLNLYAGLIEVGGSGKYLTSFKSEENTIKGSFYYKLVKEDDELMIENLWADSITNNEIEKIFNLPVLFGTSSQNATHIIIKRQYGADLFFTFTSKKGDRESLKCIQNKLEVGVIEANASLGINNETKNNTSFSDIHVSFYGDCKPPTKYKGTVESVLDSLQEISELTETPKQMKWILYPIHHLTKIQDLLKEKMSENENNNWLKLGYIASPSKFMLPDYNNENYRLLFYNWDILLSNKQKLDYLEKQIHSDDINCYRYIINDIKSMQIFFNTSYKNTVIDKIMEIKENLNLNQLIETIDKLNMQIEKYINSQVHLNINKNGQPNVINDKGINNLKGLNYIRFIDKLHISRSDYDDMNDYIKNTRNTFLQKCYYFYCNKEKIKINKEKTYSIVRYIRLCQENVNIPIDQRFLNINSIEIYDANNNKISLHTKFIKIKYSSKSQEWSSGDLYSSNLDTYFHSNNDTFEWIYIDLGTEMHISKICINNRISTGNPHDNIIRLTGCILSLYRDYSSLNNKYLVSQYLITARAYKYVFDLTNQENKTYLMVFKRKTQDFDYKRDLFVYNIDKADDRQVQCINYNERTESKSDSNIYNNSEYPKPAYHFEWTNENEIKINEYDITNQVIFEKDWKGPIVEINKTFQEKYIGNVEDYEILYLPYYVELEDKNEEIHYTFYKFWNKTLLQSNTNLIMWYKDKEIETIVSIDSKYLLDLVMPCPHDMRKDCKKNWVCYNCFSIAKVRNINNKWYFNCYECKKVVNIVDCYFICNNELIHGPEPYPFNDSFDCDSLKFHYMNCVYMIDNPVEHVYNQIIVDNDEIKFTNLIIPRSCVNVSNEKDSIDEWLSPCYYTTFSPFTIYCPNHCLEREYITIDMLKHCGHYFFIRKNFVYYRKLKCSSYNNTIKRLTYEFNSHDGRTDQFKRNTRWMTDIKNISLTFFEYESSCKINEEKYDYYNINPHAIVIEYKKNKKLSKYLKRNVFQWIILMNTHLNKLFCVEFKNGKTNNWYTASLIEN